MLKTLAKRYKPLPRVRRSAAKFKERKPPTNFPGTGPTGVGPRQPQAATAPGQTCRQSHFIVYNAKASSPYGLHALSYSSLLGSLRYRCAAAYLTEAACVASFEACLASITAEQGEKSDIREIHAHRTFLRPTMAMLGPRPFVVALPSGTDNTFFVHRKHVRSLLRLYGHRKGFIPYTNNLTYISTRELPGFACQE